MSKKHTESFAIGSSISRVMLHHTEHGSYLDGDVLTKYGIVSVYSQGGKNPSTRMDFVYGGRHHMRTELKTRCIRGMAILATKFAREVTEAQ